jgi:Tol biopolymer transport system component
MTSLPRRTSRYPIVLGLALLLLGATAEPLAAQYFGRNQVQYRTFDFRILQTEHFDVYHYPEAEEAARAAARMAERWYNRLSRLLDHQFEHRQPLIIYANHPEFQQNNVTGDLGEGVQGVTEAFKQRIVIPFMHSQQDTDHLIGHELVHAFQFDISGLGRAGAGLEAAARRFQAPLWFIEGMAQYLSVGPVDPHAAMWLRDGALSGQLPTIPQMTQLPQLFNPYRWGHAFFAYVGGRWGDVVIGQILKLVGEGVPYPEAFQRVLNQSLNEIGEDWRTAIRRAYLPLLAERQEAREVAQPLITRTTRGGRINLAPSLSPDGGQLIFLSELGELDVELHLADATSGEVIRRLVRGANLDPHFGSLRFIASAGTWSPDGRRFAFSALREGADVLVVLDVERARIEREYRVAGVGEIANPSWSPDGRTVAFSGMAGGISNLYALDLDTGHSRQLTDRAFADLQPAFSPDGRTLAFVTEAGADASVAELHFPGYRLALLDLETGSQRFVPAADGAGANNINPVWTRDGNGLYFVSNRTGIPNVYRVELATGTLFQITDLFGGVSGISELSPAITAARDADRLLFTAFERNGYNIYSVSGPEALAGAPSEAPELVSPEPAPARTALFPPSPRPEEDVFNRVAHYMEDSATGLPSPAAAEEFTVRPYRPRLGLDWLGQPQVGVSVGGGAFGRSGVTGGIAGIFSDMLGRHTLFGAVQAQGQFDEIGFSSAYLYRRTRWNYGLAAQRIPFVFPAFRQGLADSETFRREFLRVRLFDTRLQGVAQYPFSRVHRVEFGAGIRRLSQDVQFFRQDFLLDQSGQIVGAFPLQDGRESGESFNMVETSAALVYDNTLFGFTSPFMGQRYRFEISPVFGSLQFVQAIADYRRYFSAQPFTFAIRGLHFGRYGRDADRFGDNFVGFPWFIRGYSPGDVEQECRENPDQCVAQQLLGSRVGVANAELRFPLISQLALGAGAARLPPVEGFLFADAGVAWRSGVTPVFRRGLAADPESRRPFVTSVGTGARINLLGLFILEAAYVNPLDRARGWHWQLALQPGF